MKKLTNVPMPLKALTVGGAFLGGTAGIYFCYPPIADLSLYTSEKINNISSNFAVVSGLLQFLISGAGLIIPGVFGVMAGEVPGLASSYLYLNPKNPLAKKYDDAKPMHQWMKDLFAKVKSVSVKDPPDKRRRLYDKCVAEMKQLIQIYFSYSHLSEVITTIKNGLEFWFTRIIHPQIEPTNNKGERSLREMVVMKRIMGTLRNQDGADVLAKMMTLISTWRLNGQNPFYSLRALI